MQAFRGLRVPAKMQTHLPEWGALRPLGDDTADNFRAGAGRQDQRTRKTWCTCLVQDPFLLWAAQCPRRFEQKLSVCLRVTTLAQEKPGAQAGDCGRSQDEWRWWVSGAERWALQELCFFLLF